MSGTGDIQKKIQDAKQNHYPVCLYGLGQLGTDMGVQFLEWLELSLEYACDKNGLAIDHYIENHPGIKKLDFESLLTQQEHMLVFVCVGAAYIEEACRCLEENPFLYLITIDDITAEDFVLEKFYGIQKIRDHASVAPLDISLPCLREEKRVAVYTCVTGGYDDIREPLSTEENCDYYLLSDRKYQNLKVYRQLDIMDYVPGSITGSAERNRWCKMHGHRLFRRYRHCIYVDGSIQLIHPVSQYVKQIGKTGIAIHKHPYRNCVYEEGLRLAANKRGNIDSQGLRKQMVRYILEGMPREYGLFECGMIVRDNFNETGNQIMEQWFEEYMRGEKRDQLSLTYILWKNGILSEEMGILNAGQDIRKNPDLVLNQEHGMKG